MNRFITALPKTLIAAAAPLFQAALPLPVANLGLVSRFRSSHHYAARSLANFGIKGTLAIYDSSAIFGFEVPTRTRGYNDRNFKSTALGDTVKFFGNDQPSLPLCVRLGRSRSPPRLPRLNPAGPPRRGFAFQATEAASVFLAIAERNRT
jgi:hypothetical protein